MIKAPAIIMYVSAMSRETVRIALTIAALNDLEVKLDNIHAGTCYRIDVDPFES